MVPRTAGVGRERKGPRGPGRASGRGGQEKRPWVASGATQVTRTSWGGGKRTGQRWREKWNAAPLRGLHSAQGLGASPPPQARRVGPFLGENHPQTRSPEASLTPGPARPCPRAAAPPYPAVCRLLPALSDLLIFHLTRRFPPPQPPPCACALIRASVAGAGTQGFTQWTPPPDKPGRGSRPGP